MNSPVLCLVIILIVIIIIIVIVGIANYSNTNSQCNNFKNKNKKMQRRRGKFTNGISCPSGYVATYSKIPVNCSTEYTANGSSYQVCSEITTSVCIPTANISTVTTTMPLTGNTVISSPYYPPATVTSLMYPPATVTSLMYYPPTTIATPITGTVATGGGGGRMPGGGRMRGGRMRGGGGGMRGGGGGMRGGGGVMRGGGGVMRGGGGGIRGRKGGFANGATDCPAGSTISQIKVTNCVQAYTKTYGKPYQSCNTITSSVCVPIVNMNNALPAAEYNALLYLQHVK